MGEPPLHARREFLPGWEIDGAQLERIDMSLLSGRITRREFIRTSAILTGGLLLTSNKPQSIDTSPIPWSVQMFDSVMRRGVPYRWHYENGLLHHAIEQVWHCTGADQYYNHIKREIDRTNSVHALPRHRGRTIQEGHLPPTRPAQRSASHVRRRILAQKDLPSSNVAGWHLYGIAILRRVRPHV
jgi:hypothetical protein